MIRPDPKDPPIDDDPPVEPHRPCVVDFDIAYLRPAACWWDR